MQPKKRHCLALRSGPCTLAACLLHALLTMASSASGAALGGSEAELDEQLASARGTEQVKTTSESNYRYREVATGDLTVKYYVNSETSKIFAVTWRGHRMPDLLSLLGFDPARLEARGGYRTLRRIDLRTDTVVLQGGGHPGSYSGRAIRVDLLPRGLQESKVAP
jgi:hypothetical protein